MTCNYCTFSSDNQFHFNWHVIGNHKDEQKHACQVCSTKLTANIKQESGFQTNISEDDDGPPSCSMVGKRSVATATTDDLFMTTASTQDFSRQNSNSSGTYSNQALSGLSSCRMSSKGINTCLPSLDSPNSNDNFLNLKTIDTSDLIDTDEYEEEDDDDEEEEEDEHTHQQIMAHHHHGNGKGQNENGNDAETDEDEEEEDDDEEDEDDDETEEEDEEVIDDDVNDKDYVAQVSHHHHTPTHTAKKSRTVHHNTQQQQDANDANEIHIIEIDSQPVTAQKTTPARTGRGKGNRKSRVTNSFLETSESSVLGSSGEVLRRKFHCSHCGKSFKTKSHLQRHILTHTGESRQSYTI